jgi:hypothetical protein
MADAVKPLSQSLLGDAADEALSTVLAQLDARATKLGLTV